MVDFLRHHARLSRLPLRHPRRRSLPYHQRRNPEESRQGTRGLITNQQEKEYTTRKLVAGCGQFWILLCMHRGIIRSGG